MGRMRGAIAAATLMLPAGQAIAQNAPPPPANAYPAPPCTPPKFQVLPQVDNAKNDPDAAKAALYEIEVKKFNSEAGIYHACLRAYILKADQDARKIQAQADAEIKRITDNTKARLDSLHDLTAKASVEMKNASTSPESLGLDNDK